MIWNKVAASKLVWEDSFSETYKWASRLNASGIKTSIPYLLAVKEFAKQHGKPPGVVVDAIIDYSNGLYNRAAEFGDGFKEFMTRLKSI